jgi:hypothetical protein
MDGTDVAQNRDKWLTLEHGNEPLGSTKSKHFPDYIRNNQLLKKVSFPRS